MKERHVVVSVAVKGARTERTVPVQETKKLALANMPGQRNRNFQKDQGPVHLHFEAVLGMDWHGGASSQCTIGFMAYDVVSSTKDFNTITVYDFPLERCTQRH